MVENTKIQWCDHTHNHWTGCEGISPACALCYAAAWAKRAGRDFAVRQLTTAANRRKPLKYEAAHKAFFAQHGRRQRVFTNSLADVFDNQVPDEWRETLWDVIRATPNLDWLLLTKRIGNAKRMLPADWGSGFPNVWLGATVVNQEEADRDIPKLLRIPAAVRFLSCEPLLEAIDLQYPESLFPDGPPRCCSGIDCGCMGKPVEPPLIYGLSWIICGGESGGKKARPMNALWANDLRIQCKDSRVAFFMKQGSQANWPRYDDFASFPPELQVREWPSAPTSDA